MLYLYMEDSNFIKLAKCNWYVLTTILTHVFSMHLFVSDYNISRLYNLIILNNK
jgi:hypothetical protein